MNPFALEGGGVRGRTPPEYFEISKPYNSIGPNWVRKRVCFSLRETLLLFKCYQPHINDQNDDNLITYIICTWTNSA